jgi:fluoride exporter
MILKVLLVGLGGGLGALGRAGVAVWVQRGAGLRFPWGTLTVNLLGCFLFGLVWAATEGRVRHLAEFRLFVLTGFMGSFTTFSTFAFDTAELAEASRLAAAVGNVAAHNVLGILGLVVGLSLGRAV